MVIRRNVRKKTYDSISHRRNIKKKLHNFKQNLVEQFLAGDRKTGERSTRQDVRETERVTRYYEKERENERSD